MKRTVATITSLVVCYVGLPLIAQADMDEKTRVAQFHHVVELNNSGVKALNQGNFAKAIALFKEVLRLDPSYTLAKENLGTALGYTGGSDEDSNQVIFRNLHRDVFYGSENLVDIENLNTFVKATGKNPKSFEDRISLATDCKCHGDSIGAFVEYSEALKIKADDEGARLSILEIVHQLDKPALEKEARIAKRRAAILLADPSLVGSQKQQTADDKTKPIEQNMTKGN